ncbi:MAG: bifunctional adenosylcobinamide kinase/adenosylcobinamide-phosphate guanylyltransferase [Oscillospiraceae bacterium]|nr:bifunctional adenosylcobinamide kinase/adenosylcobinamide-phosphate guanylyltransferase [Oscillospiraceae bacterium]
MIMITGGAYQGKTEFVRSRFLCSITDGEACDLDSVFSAECIGNYHLLVKRLLARGDDPIAFTERLCRENPDLIVIMNEIGGGIVPIEKEDRIWREQVGRAGCIIADISDTVVRICCGIPTVIKGEML